MKRTPGRVRRIHALPGRSRQTSALAATLALGLSLTACSSHHKKKAGPPPPPAQTAPPDTKLDGASSLTAFGGLRKPVKYHDAITVAITKIRKLRAKGTGPGSIAGRQLTVFTVRFTNGSAQNLDLNKTQVVAMYGSQQAKAQTVSYGNLNDFYGTVPAGQDKSASYAYALPSSGYKKVTLKVTFDDKHKVAVFAGSLR